MVFNIGDRVLTNGFPNYDNKIPTPKNSTGTIVYLRKRYQNSPSAYIQYKVHIDGKECNLNDLEDLYNEFDIQKIN